MILDTFSLAGRVGIVTGGGQGLGKTFCRAFAEAGADVVVAELNPQTGPQTVAEVEALGRRALFVQTDVADAASVAHMVEETLRAFGKIDFLMNNAGIDQHLEAEKVAPEDWRRHMIERRSGCIINIASMSGLIVNTPQCQASYNASKAGVIHLTKSLAAEWAAYNVRVNAIAPGYMNTEMARPFFEDPAWGGVWMKSIPMHRPGEPEELAPAAIYLASDASSYVTGATLVIDGGYTVW